MKVASFQSERERRWLRLSGLMAALAMLVVLAGCGNGKCDIPGAGRTQQGTASNLRIEDYGPHEAKAGQPFNRQSDGSSAAWFRLNESMEGSVVNVHLNNIVVKGDISGPLVTVRVPDDLYVSEGRITISIDKVDGATVISSNSVSVAVSKP